jgi:ATP-binding cassette subfamily C protein
LPSIAATKAITWPQIAAGCTYELPMMRPSTGISSGRKELLAALAACRSAFIATGIVSGLINVLYLTGSFYMLEVYDRVVPSRSVPTLIGISILALLLFAFQFCLDLLRGRVLIRVGRSLGNSLSGRVYDALARLPLRSRVTSDGLQPLRDLDQVRSFLSSAGPIALLDFPWLPLYLVICFLFHPMIGVAALIGSAILVTITFLAERKTRGPAKAATSLAIKRNAIAESSRRNAEVIQSMGMTPQISARWVDVNNQYLEQQQRVSDVGSGFGSFSKIMRMTIQSAVLGMGSYLVIQQEATSGIIIASSILTSRALAPVETIIANWKGFIAARQSWERLQELLTLFRPEQEQLSLPPPDDIFAAESVSVIPPGTQTPVVHNVSFKVQKGSALGIIGPSGGGKSCLVRALVGVWPARGSISLDGAALGQWPASALGRHIGYLPQDVELFGGNIAENIARFDPHAKDSDILAAAKAAGIHDMVVRMPRGYETEIGEGGTALSAGQRQRIGLARALYGNPFLIVLDEPNSNLDPEGEEALTKAILGIRARGGIAIIVAHRPSALAGVDLILVINQGSAQAFGPKEEVLSSIIKRPAPPSGMAPGLRVVPEAGGVAS